MYVYIWKDQSGLPFYVGLTKRIGRANPKNSGGRNWLTRQKLQSIGAENVVVEFHTVASIIEGQELERKLIEQYGRLQTETGSLTNLRVGGEGMHIPTEEHKEKLIREFKTRRWWNNGVGDKHTTECLGEDWVLGRLYSRKLSEIEIENIDIRLQAEKGNLDTLRALDARKNKLLSIQNKIEIENAEEFAKIVKRSYNEQRLVTDQRMANLSASARNRSVLSEAMLGKLRKADSLKPITLIDLIHFRYLK
jgi:hypothetical protein